MKASGSGAEEKIFYVCTQCGNCCKWPGIVRASEETIGKMSKILGITEERFIAEYTQVSPDRLGLILVDREDGACVMLGEDNRCKVYEGRPDHCKDFPHGWNFPGWEKECPAVPMPYTMTKVEPEDDAGCR